MSYLPLLEAAVTGALAADKDSQEHHQLVNDEKRWAHRVRIINQEMVEDSLRRENLSRAYQTLQTAKANHNKAMNDIAAGRAVLTPTNQVASRVTNQVGNQPGKVLVTVDNKHASIRRIPYRVISSPHHHHHHSSRQPHTSTSGSARPYASQHLVKHHHHHHHVL
eukprot:TRINITY_DN19482_c0_g1_i1.p1 TRINITY_DN19482_c0_g1~~TRINITY_DN19482_c0_g1_i1.p1  ORF type:complete len:165 (+),score=26.01 TRINITY_DN19482_c0_g1_i1:294-788(+)